MHLAGFLVEQTFISSTGQRIHFDSDILNMPFGCDGWGSIRKGSFGFSQERSRHFHISRLVHLFGLLASTATAKTGKEKY